LLTPFLLAGVQCLVNPFYPTEALNLQDGHRGSQTGPLSRFGLAVVLGPVAWFLSLPELVVVLSVLLLVSDWWERRQTDLLS
jgi:hypothetical protein